MKKEIDKKGRLIITFTKSEAKRLKEDLREGRITYDTKLLFDCFDWFLEKQG